MTDPHDRQATQWPAPAPTTPAPVGVRPGAATAAAVLAFVQAGLLLLAVLAIVVAAVADDVPGNDVGVAVLVAVVACTLAGLDLLGGLFLLRGAGRTLLLVGTWIEVGLLGLLFLVVLADAVTGNPVDPTADLVGVLVLLVLAVVPVVRLVQATRPAVGSWLAARQRAAAPPVWSPQGGRWVPAPAAPATPTGLVAAVLAPVAVFAVVSTLLLALGSAQDPVVQASGYSGSGEPVDPPSPGNVDYDPEYAELADDCHDGDMSACDDLYFQTPVDDPYETYGTTCGGRLDDETYGDCVGVFGPTD